MGAQMVMPPSASVTHALPPPGEYGALLASPQQLSEAVAVGGGGYSPRGRRVTAVPMRVWCTRRCRRVGTIGCGTNVAGFKLKFDLYHLPQVLLLLYVGALVTNKPPRHPYNFVSTGHL